MATSDSNNQENDWTLKALRAAVQKTRTALEEGDFKLLPKLHQLLEARNGKVDIAVQARGVWTIPMAIKDMDIGRTLTSEQLIEAA